MKDREESLYVAFFAKIKIDEQLNNKNLQRKENGKKPKRREIEEEFYVSSAANLNETTLSASMWAKYLEVPEVAIQLVRLYMPKNEFDELLATTRFWGKAEVENFLLLNESCRPPARSLQEIALQKVQEILQDKENPENENIKNTIAESPWGVRLLFSRNYKVQRMLANKPKQKNDPQQSPSEREEDSSQKPTHKK